MNVSKLDFDETAVNILFEDKGVADVWTKRVLCELDGIFLVLNIRPDRTVVPRAFLRITHAAEFLEQQGICMRDLLEEEAMEPYKSWFKDLVS